MGRLLAGVISILALIAFSAGDAAAQVKIGVLDVTEFQERSVAFQRIREQLRIQFDRLQQKLEDEREALLKLEEDYQRQSMMLSLDAQDDKRRELEKKRRYYNYLYEDLSEQMMDKERDATRRILNELEDVVKDIARQEGLTIVLERNSPGVIHVDDSVNITSRVVQAYDRMNQ